MTDAVKILIASGSDAVIDGTIEKFSTILPEIPLVVVSEFRPAGGEWIPYHIRRSWLENYQLIRSRLRGRRVRLAAVILEPGTPHRRMRLLAPALAPWQVLAFNETGQHFRLRPDNALVILRHGLWRFGNLVRAMRRREPVRRPRGIGPLYLRARMQPWLAGAAQLPQPWPARDLAPGISVVIPSRNGRALLETCLPRFDAADEIIVVDNGSDDGSAAYAAAAGALVEHSAEPLSFADAVNRGLRRARFSHVCLLNNDMLVEPGFLAALRRAFDQIPDLFGASAQIFFPPGQRREETGKTVWAGERAVHDFPVRCDEPLEGEDLTWVLYGSGGCTLYDARKLAALGGFDPVYETAYVEDLDLGLRAWKRGWPTVYCAGARVLHHHRATTSRYFTEAQLDVLLEQNFLRCLGRVLPDRVLWRTNLRRLRDAGKKQALEAAPQVRFSPEPPPRHVLDLTSGEVAVFPGRAASGQPKVLVAAPYLPYPLSHGAAVRMYNLMRRAAPDFDQILVCFVEQLAPVPPELLEICCEIVIVRRPGTHALPSTSRPDTVEEFDSPAYHAALEETCRKWHPDIAQLEFTQMAQYAPDCRHAATVLVEHDITYDLYAQMLQRENDWEARRQHDRWIRFETGAWKSVDRVVTMSERDQKMAPGSVVIPNGVDLERFRPSERSPEPRRLLFIGSFAHHPNVMAVQFFLREVLPRLENVTLHVIAGQRHERFWDLREPGVEVEGFVSDVRPAYERAAVVIAPLVASAGTNIKILEAMAMGKAIVSTSAGVHGLALEAGADVIVTDSAAGMAREIETLLSSPDRRTHLEQHARRTVEQRYGWDAIAQLQKDLYATVIRNRRRA